jgi:hypothetical protein
LAASSAVAFESGHALIETAKVTMNALNAGRFDVFMKNIPIQHPRAVHSTVFLFLAAGLC